MAALVLMRSDRPNDYGFAGLHQRINYLGLHIVGLVCNDRVRLGVLEQHVCAFNAMGLS